MINAVNKFYSKTLIGLICGLSLLLGFLGSFLFSAKAQAYLDGFDPGNIMSDYVMGSSSTMDEASIQRFLKSKNHCNDRNLAKMRGYEHLGYHVRDGHFVCMADESFNGESAAHIIWQAAKDYGVNPQVLLVLIEKEQSLVTDTWPNQKLQYAHATGFACPDTADCDPLRSGFKNQIRQAAQLFGDVLKGGWSNYPAYSTKAIAYNPNPACGSMNVYISNRATSALYRYTPYVPNRAALNAGYGIGDSCSAYGNRNFYNLFTDWFGSTNRFIVRDGMLDGYNKVGGLATLGNPTMNEKCGLKDNGCYQTFEKGVLYWTPKFGAHALIGGNHQRWMQLGYEHGILGYPVSNEIPTKDGGTYQAFEGGAMYYSPGVGSFENYGMIRKAYEKFGFENGFLGYPVSKVTCGLKHGACLQTYQNGTLYSIPNIGDKIMYGGIRGKWIDYGCENGVLGFPVGDEKCNNKGDCSRQFENGTIYWTQGRGYVSYGEIAKKYNSIGGLNSSFGAPSMDQRCGIKDNGCYQTYQREGGSIYFSARSGAHTLYGGIRSKWVDSGYEWGGLAYPTDDEHPYNGGTLQNFQGGTIAWKNGRAVINYK